MKSAPKPLLPLAVVALVMAVLLGGLLRRSAHPAEERFGQLPVLHGGRVKPLDSVARNALLMFSGRQSLAMNDRRMGASEWLLELMFRPDAADGRKVFEIDDPEVLGILGIQRGKDRRYAFRDLAPHLGEIDVQAKKADQVRAEQRTRFQTAVVNLRNRLVLYQKLQNTLGPAGARSWLAEINQFERMLEGAGHHSGAEMIGAFADRYRALAEASEFRPLPVPGDPVEHWVGVGDALLVRFQAPALHPGVVAYARMADTYRQADKAGFAEAVEAYGAWLKAEAPGTLGRTAWEEVFNRFQPFYKALVLYGLVCLLVFASFLFWPERLRGSAAALLWLAFFVHTAGLLARIWLQGRPPVTNLYSSAVFVGWVAVLLGVVIERLYKNGLGALAASAVGFLTQIIALHLATQGDTLEMMRAVLDSNFWLATHVTTVTIGYSSTFLAGFFGVFYILRGLFSRRMTAEHGRVLARMAYGVICFSTFFSFVGTVLGGIWADQSWGRFWGWDPKENGALMIVLWNALLLHLRWGGFAGQRGLMVLAVFGNIITALSWFGVNMLGIGLHSYGFMDKAFPWLTAFTVSQALIIGLGMLPDRFWASRPWPGASVEAGR